MIAFSSVRDGVWEVLMVRVTKEVGDEGDEGASGV